jgi:peptidoglycan hydrolase-like protein with peptidoglycan-binding domain
MTAARVRIGLSAFLLLSVSVSVNMVFFQPVATRLGAAVYHGEVAGSAKGRSPLDAGTPADTIRAVQRELARLGYEIGQPDGRRGLVTEAAIMAFEHDHGLPLTGEATDALLQQIVLGVPDAPGRSTASRADKRMTSTAENVIRKVQQQLAAAGYQPVAPTGVVDEPTQRAIREFENAHKLRETGRISSELVARLALGGKQAKR